MMMVVAGGYIYCGSEGGVYEKICSGDGRCQAGVSEERGGNGEHNRRLMWTEIYSTQVP